MDWLLESLSDPKFIALASFIVPGFEYADQQRHACHRHRQRVRLHPILGRYNKEVRQIKVNLKVLNLASMQRHIGVAHESFELTLSL